MQMFCFLNEQHCIYCKAANLLVDFKELVFVIYTHLFPYNGPQEHIDENLCVGCNKLDEAEMPSQAHAPNSGEHLLPYQYATNRGHWMKSQTLEFKHF